VVKCLESEPLCGVKKIPPGTLNHPLQSQ